MKGRLVCLVLLCACEAKPIGEIPAEEGIARIRQSAERKEWDRVVEDVGQFRTRYPYSAHGSEADLLQADGYFELRRFPESIASYEDFLRKYPKYHAAPYAALRTAKSFDEESSVETDREQDYTAQAISKYQALMTRFPQAPECAQARERLQLLQRRVAEHEQVIARFYRKQGLTGAALSRYLSIAEKYKAYPDIRQEALAACREAYLKLARQLEGAPGLDTTAALLSATPESLRKQAESLPLE